MFQNVCLEIVTLLGSQIFLTISNMDQTIDYRGDHIVTIAVIMRSWSQVKCDIYIYIILLKLQCWHHLNILALALN